MVKTNDESPEKDTGFERMLGSGDHDRYPHMGLLVRTSMLLRCEDWYEGWHVQFLLGFEAPRKARLILCRPFEKWSFWNMSEVWVGWSLDLSIYIYLSYNATTTSGRSSEDVRKHVWKQMEGPISTCASPLRSSVSLSWTPPSLSLWVGHMRTRPSFHESWWGVGRDWTNHQRGVCR